MELTEVKLDKRLIESMGWRLEIVQDSIMIFILVDTIFAQKPDDQIDIIYELDFDIDANYMILSKYSNGAKGVILYDGDASLEILKEQTKLLDL